MRTASFLWANGLTLAALAVLALLDEINIALHLIAPGDRIITEKVIMALLGATTVQVGAIRCHHRAPSVSRPTGMTRGDGFRLILAPCANPRR